MNKTILIEASLRNRIDYEKSVIYASALFSGMDIAFQDAELSLPQSL